MAKREVLHAALFPELVQALEEARESIEADMGEWAPVTRTYLPFAYWKRRDALDIIEAALAKVEELEEVEEVGCE